MKMLAFDTVGETCSVAIYDSENTVKPLTTLHQISPKQQAQIILPTIQQALALSGLTLKDLTVIAVAVGPGSFTGVRIASSVAQGLAFGLSLPVICVSSLAAMAQSAFLDKGWQKIVVAVDGRMNKVYLGEFSLEANGIMVATRKENSYDPDAVSTSFNGDYYGVGDAWQAYPLALEPLAADPQQETTATAIIQLALSSKEEGSAFGTMPVYL